MKKAIIQRILATLDDDAPVRAIAVGPRATAVVSRGVGIAYHFRRDAFEETTQPPLPHSTRELAARAGSDDPIAASLGIAAINSLIAVDDEQIEQRNGVELALDWARGKRAVMVGHFPFADRLRAVAAHLDVLELRPQPGDLPAGAAADVLPQAEVAVITGTTFVNGTIDGLLALCPQARVLLIGPTTIMAKRLFAYGIEALCGVRVVDEAAALEHVRSGGCFRALPGAEQIVLRRQ